MNHNLNVTLSLISHTNAGKTTLARTLLRRDVGEVLDRPHVTDISEAHALVELDTGERLLLWDTPGFGDTARLLRRLRISDNPIGWILTQVWDRFADRPFWCSQQAIRNVRDEADVVLYLVNAAENPEQAAYVAMEMEILEWIGKPVLVLLNQTGPPRDPANLNREAEKWRVHLERFPDVRDILNLDAFTRCWVQEKLLLERVAALLTLQKAEAFDRLRRAWNDRNWETFERSMSVLIQQLANAVCDREPLEKKNLSEMFRKLLIREPLSDEQRAMALLAERQSRNIAEGTDELIRLHGLDGKAAVEILQRLKSDYSTAEPLDEGVATVIGACVSGALAGLSADILSGGLTVGGGAIVGAIVGALGAKGLAKGYNLVRGERHPYVRCSLQWFEGLAQSGLLRYLAVAHFGRGRGDYVDTERPKFWQTRVSEVVAARHAVWAEVWAEARTNTDPAKMQEKVTPVLHDCAREVLRSLYPENSDFAD